jgi:hypothetical protein
VTFESLTQHTASHYLNSFEVTDTNVLPRHDAFKPLYSEPAAFRWILRWSFMVGRASLRAAERGETCVQGGWYDHAQVWQLNDGVVNGDSGFVGH